MYCKNRTETVSLLKHTNSFPSFIQ